MSKMKSLLAMYTMAAMSAEANRNIGRLEEKEPYDNKIRRLKLAEIERNKKNGLKEFFYGENSIWALNQKSADKKARKRNWIG